MEKSFFFGRAFIIATKPTKSNAVLNNTNHCTYYSHNRKKVWWVVCLREKRAKFCLFILGIDSIKFLPILNPYKCSVRHCRTEEQIAFLIPFFSQPIMQSINVNWTPTPHSVQLIKRNVCSLRSSIFFPFV